LTIISDICRYFPGNMGGRCETGCNVLVRQEEHVIIVDGLRLWGRSCHAGRDHEKKGGGTPLLILCHGIPGANPQQVSVSEEKDGGYHALADRCLQEGFKVFHFNFRGAGESEGNFDLAGWRRDLTAVLDYWEKERGENTFLLWGFSAGAAVSCCVAAGDPRVRGLVMAAAPAEFVSLFSSRELQLFLERMRQRGLIRDPLFPPDPARWLHEIHATSPLLYIKNVPPRPLLIIHGRRDELVPCRHAFQLHKKAGRAAQLVILPKGRHQLRRYSPAIERCLQWMRKQMDS
jgi:uncharacterized protein